LRQIKAKTRGRAYLKNKSGTTLILATLQTEAGRSWPKAAWAKAESRAKAYLSQAKARRARGVDQVVECLLSKCKALSSNPRTT
jgi:hypothetical protein